MRTEEDEAFDELARKQGDWGGGFPAKRKMTMDKLQEFCTCLETQPMECQGCRANRLAQPAKRAMAADRFKDGIEWWMDTKTYGACPNPPQWHIDTGNLVRLVPQSTWVSLTDAEIDKTYWRREPFRRPTQFEFARDIEQLLKERNNG